jgi:succinate-acetate transporter protein
MPVSQTEGLAASTTGNEVCVLFSLSNSLFGRMCELVRLMPQAAGQVPERLANVDLLYPFPAFLMSSTSTPTKQGNPAVVGLAGFGLTTLMLQFHNVGWAGLGPVIWLGIVFGGAAQLIAGLQEKAAGNNFGYCAFTSYGAFWISLALMLLGNQLGIFKVSHHDVGWFLVGWTLFTAILWVGALRIHGAMAWTFTLLLVGFILLDVAHFCSEELAPTVTKIAGYELMACALAAWYMMGRIIINDTYGREVLPAGQPWIKG